MTKDRIAELRKKSNEYGAYVMTELLDEVEATQGALEDTIEAMGHMQDEVEQLQAWKRIAQSGCEQIDEFGNDNVCPFKAKNSEFQVTVEELTTDRDEWKRVAEQGEQK